MAVRQEPSGTDGKSERRIWVRTTAVTAAIFIVDIFTPLGYADWLFYMLPLLLSLPLSRKGASYILASLITALIVASTFLSPSYSIPARIAVINHVLGVIAIWIVAALLERYKQAISLETLTRELTEANERLQYEIREHRILEEELRKREKEFSTLAENSPNAIARINAQMAIEYANPFASRILGLSQRLSRGTPIGGLPIAEINKELMSRRTAEVLSSGKEFVGEVYLPLPRGTRYLTVRYEPEFDENGKVATVLAIYHDVTDMKAAQQKAVEARELAEKRAREAEEGTRILDALMEYIPLGMALVSTPDLRIVRMSRYGKELVGEERRAMEGLEHWWNIFKLDGTAPGEKEYPSYRAAVDGEVITNEEWLLRRPNGETLVVLSDAGPIRDTRGKVTGAIIAWRDITERKKIEEHIKYLSFHDKVTGLYNWTYFSEELRRLDTPRELPLSVIMADVNNLKLTNDIFGHQEGDRLLQTLAAGMQKTCRDEDIIARWGGDEFVILLPATDAATAEKIGERIKRSCAETEGLPLRCSVSLGAATKEKNAQNIGDIIRRAEERMYKNKVLEGGRNREAIMVSMLSRLENIETRRHLDRMKVLAEEAGKALGLHRKQQDDLTLLAVLHDVGKTALPDPLLEQSGPLDPEQWSEMRKHPEVGYRIAHALPELADIAEDILSHHERWDGSGYPRGLKDDEIPFLVRLLAILDAYDAMTHVRPYKGALTHEEAIEELRKGAGRQFDPELVEIFLRKVFPEIRAPADTR